jgi:hypothetical protein
LLKKPIFDMDHIVYLDKKAKELENLQKGVKSMMLRAASGRKLPYGRVAKGDRLYFTQNDASATIYACALVDDVSCEGPLSPEASQQLVVQHQHALQLNEGLMKRFAGKRFVVLISLKDFHMTNPFLFDRSAYGNMDDWLPVEDIRKVVLNTDTSKSWA